MSVVIQLRSQYILITFFCQVELLITFLLVIFFFSIATEADLDTSESHISLVLIVCQYSW